MNFFKKNVDLVKGLDTAEPESVEVKVFDEDEMWAMATREERIAQIRAIRMESVEASKGQIAMITDSQRELIYAVNMLSEQIRQLSFSTSRGLGDEGLKRAQDFKKLLG